MPDWRSSGFMTDSLAEPEATARGLVARTSIPPEGAAVVGAASITVGVTGDSMYPERLHERLASRPRQEGRELPRGALRARYPHLEAPSSDGVEHRRGDLLGRHHGKGARAGLAL